VRDDRDVSGGSHRSIWQLARTVAIIGGACALILAFMALFTQPVEPTSPNAVGTGEWTLISAPRDCRATDSGGFAYSGELTNHSDSRRDFQLEVIFDVDGRRQATGTARITGLEVGSEAPVRVVVPASFPESLPDVRCHAGVRHTPVG
jgi:hypothetical protein